MRDDVGDEILTLAAVKLAQPGLLSDITDAYDRLKPETLDPREAKKDIHDRLARLVMFKLVRLYAGRRYMLTSKGESRMALSGLRVQVDQRRLHLLKETRRNNLAERSDTRDRLLKQQP